MNYRISLLCRRFSLANIRERLENYKRGKQKRIKTSVKRGETKQEFKPNAVTKNPTALDNLYLDVNLSLSEERTKAAAVVSFMIH